MLSPLAYLPLRFLQGKNAGGAGANGQGADGSGYSNSAFSPLSLLHQNNIVPYGYAPYGGKYSVGGVRDQQGNGQQMPAPGQNGAGQGYYPFWQSQMPQANQNNMQTADGDQSLELFAPPVSDFAPKTPSTADGFIKAVKKTYGGDMAKAMKDKGMRAWAESLNLMKGNQSPNLNVNLTRSTAINKILSDNTLSSSKKYNVLKILMQ